MISNDISYSLARFISLSSYHLQRYAEGLWYTALHNKWCKMYLHLPVKACSSLKVICRSVNCCAFATLQRWPRPKLSSSCTWSKQWHHLWVSPSQPVLAIPPWHTQCLHLWLGMKWGGISCGSLVPRPLPDFILQLWRKNDHEIFSTTVK